MKPPRWMVIEFPHPAQFGVTEDGENYMTVRIRVRKWHPGFWWFLIRHGRNPR